MRIQENAASASLGRRVRDGRAKPRTLLSAKDSVPERSRGLVPERSPGLVPERSPGLVPERSRGQSPSAVECGACTNSWTVTERSRGAINCLSQQPRF
jgi:hypothetical protein